MAWTKVISADELAPGARQVVKVEKQSLLVLNEAGQIYAINSICPHLKFPLKKGKITADGSIVCPFHRSAFDLKTGNVKSWCPWPPVVGNLLSKVSPEKTLSVFPTRIENGQIMVDL